MDDRQAPTSISVVIPCHNGMPYLPEALDSALAQTLKPVQIIVVDDGSTDGSAACVREYQAHHPGAGIQLVQQNNLGESAARNAGIAAGTGPWVAQLDADDWWEPGKLEAQARSIADAGPECVMAHTGQITHHADGRTDACPMQGAAERVGWCTARLIEPVAISHSSVLARRDALKRIGGYDAKLRHAVDIDVYFKLSAEGTFAFAPAHLTHYRLHDKQTSWKNKVEQVRHNDLVVRRFFDTHPDLADKIGREAIDAALARHVAGKLESFWWNRRLDAFRQLLAFADERGYDSEAIAAWRRRGRWPNWLIRLKDRFGGTADRTRKGA